ncbi:hypothetical protein GGI07_004424 [Coemansia sp. Benny D115]|nr:hypothetical protein GGI07_004424 [Coemansia sp. Benny D115]
MAQHDAVHLFAATAPLSKSLHGAGLSALDIKQCMPPTAAGPHTGSAARDSIASLSVPPPLDEARWVAHIDRTQVLGTGQFSTVCRGTLTAVSESSGDARQVACAVKIPHENNLDARELALVEAAVLSQLGAQEAVVRCYGLVDLEAADGAGNYAVRPWAEVGALAVAGTGGRWALVLELCEGGTCWEWMQANRTLMGAELFFRWARQLALALAAMESVSVAHKDIKGHNMLIDDNCDIRLADFTATEFSADALVSAQAVCPSFRPLDFPAYTDFSATIPYSSPEALAALTLTKPRTSLNKMDVYSAGVTLYTLFVSGVEPFAAVKSSVEQMLLASRGAFWEWEDRQYLVELPNRAETAPSSPTELVPQSGGGPMGLARTMSLSRRRTLKSRAKAPREYKRFLSGEPLSKDVEALLADMTNPDPAMRPDAAEILHRLNTMEPDMFEPMD